MKILFIGCGSIGRRHITNLRSILKKNVEILAYRTFLKSHHLEENFFKDYHVKQFSSLKEALDQKPDIAFITNPTSLHIPVALKAAKAGCHLFIEKPLSHNLKGINELEFIVKKKKLITFIGFNLRFHPIIMEVSDLLFKKEIGDIISVRTEVGSFLPNWHSHENYSTNYSALPDLGGGVVLDLIHDIDYTTSFVKGGYHSVDDVYCVGGKYSKLKIKTEDIAEIVMRAGNSILSVHMDYLQHPPVRKSTIIGTKGVLDIDLIKNQGMFHSLDNTFLEIKPSFYLDPNLSYMDELRYFLDCIKKKKQTFADITDGKQILQIALAAKKSMNTGRRVVLR